MTDLTTIARPYAKAAFDFAIEHNSVEKWQAMLGFASEVSQNDQVKNILTSDVKPEVIAKFIEDICQEILDEYGRNFIKIMAENRRLSLLPDLLSLFNQYCLEREKVADVDLISATELSETQLNKIIKAVEQRLSKKVKLKCEIDKSLISGFIIRAGDMVIDSSIKGRLNRLNDVLQS